MEQYYEQNVTNRNIDARTKRTRTLTIAKSICIVIGILPLILTAMFMTDSGLFFMVFVLIGVSLPFFGTALIINHFNKRNNTEYDYVIDGEKISISEVYFRQSRKLKHTIRLRTIESVGTFNSQGYKKVERNAVKKQLALVNFDNEKTIVYIYYIAPKGRKIIFIEPDRGFITALKRSVTAMTVFDDSMDDLIELLNEKEAETNDIS